MLAILKEISLFLLLVSGSLIGIAAERMPPALAPAQASPPGFVLPSVGDATSLPAVEITTFRFEGNTVVATSELEQLTAPYRGQRLSATELEEVRTRITRHYIALGYLNSGALLAPADAAGVVTIRIVEGRIDDLHLRGQGRLQPDYIRARLLRDDEVLNMAQLQERFRLLLTDPLFEKVNGRIVPGDTLGRAVLDVDVVRARPYGLSLLANNYRPPSVGAEAIGASGWVRNLSGHGDLLEASLQHSQGGDPLRLGWSVPVNAYGTGLRASVERGSAAVIEEPLDTIDIKSRSSGYELGITQNLVDSLKRKIDLGVAYGRRRSSTTLLGQPFSFVPGEPDGVSRVRALRLSQNWTERGERQALAARSVFAFGHTNVDADASPEPVAARRYSIWTGQLQFVQHIGERGAQLLLRGATQLTPDRLLPIERFALGGVATVRGYRENAVVRDAGYAASAEFHTPLWAAAEDRRLTLVTFADIGCGWNRDQARQKLASAGIGLNWRMQGFSADLYLAKKLKRLEVESHGNLQDQGLHFQLSYSLF